MSNQPIPPKFYYAVRDFGPIFRLPIPKTLDANVMVYRAWPPPASVEPDIYEYRFIGMEPNHNWFSKDGHLLRVGPCWVYEFHHKE
jgi:hypothetical protein